MSAPNAIPVIDLFSGPGGLGEGFARFGERDWKKELSDALPTESGSRRLIQSNDAATRRERQMRFHIALSLEKDAVAHQTLQLRAFYRAFGGRAPADYYAHLRGELSREALFGAHREQAEHAAREAVCAELGVHDEKDIDRRIKAALNGNDNWVLIGGPPCQAYSLVGRSRRSKIEGYTAAEDNRHFLYEEYLRIVSVHAPPVFVMENVKGLLSSRVEGEGMFERILGDLTVPGRAAKRGGSHRLTYKVFALSHAESTGVFGRDRPGDFVIRMEQHGIPQARHRVILLGIRDDGADTMPDLLGARRPVPASHVLKGLPRIRSGLSRQDDSPEAWKAAVRGARDEAWFDQIQKMQDGRDIQRLMRRVLKRIENAPSTRGRRFVPWKSRIGYAEHWYIDPKLEGVCNHDSRAHISPDLHRYVFAACFAEVRGVSPRLADFPRGLLPLHRSAETAVKTGGHFDDRFRVQLQGRPSTTVTSHISKDGHYYIHYDPKQCRSLTVRESARLQTFPDNYFFCGNRTQQYHQVGNAVPPLLAVQIAEIVAGQLARRSGG